MEFPLAQEMPDGTQSWLLKLRDIHQTEDVLLKEIYEKIGKPQFSVFGGGFGENAIVMGDTYVNVEMEGRGSILEGIDIVKGEEYKHFFNGYSVMDIIGGGYSVKVFG